MSLDPRLQLKIQIYSNTCDRFCIITFPYIVIVRIHKPHSLLSYFSLFFIRPRNDANTFTIGL